MLAEKIITKPHNTIAYLTLRQKELKHAFQTISTAQELIKAHRDEEDLAYRFLRYGSDYNDAAEDFTNLVYALTRSDAKRQFERILESLDSVLQFGTNRAHGASFWGYLSRAIAEYVPLKDDLLKVIPILATAHKGAADYGYDTPDTYDAEYKSAMALVNAVASCVHVIVKIEKTLASMNSKMSALMDFFANGENYRPAHDNVETLYHASIFAADIAKKGFSATKPEDRRGLGNYGEQSTISFTHDLETARTIMRAFKELWLIANGQVKARDVMSWIEKEKIDISKARSYLGYDPMAAKTPEQVAKLWRWWIAHSPLREDPVFVSPEELIPTLKTVRLSDIGVLACEVALEKGDEYHFGEAEFRLSPDRVRSVKRLF